MTDSTATSLQTIAENIAVDAAAYVRHRRPEVFDPTVADRRDAVRAKSTPTDPVTVVDTETEDLLREWLARLRPGEAVLGEEHGGPAVEAAPGAVTWVLDPIDGTVNFLYGIPAYAVSVAAQIDGRSVAGAVADVAAARVYSAARGGGAHVLTADGVRSPLRCNELGELSMALVGTGFGYAPSRRRRQAALLAAVLPDVRDVRRIGSAALDLCAVAAGRLDAYYEHGLQRWDWAAGALIAVEAGARVHRPTPGALGALVAAAPAIMDDLTGLLARHSALDELPDAP